MENEKTYEQWEMEVKEGLAAIPTGELVLTAASIATALVQRLLFVRGNISRQTEEPMVVDNNLLEELKERMAQCAVMVDVLQLRFGDVAEQEVAFLEDMQRLMEELSEG